MIAPTNRASSWVYLVTEAGSDFCKIGLTNGDLEPRVHKLQTGNPRQLELEVALHGDIHIERAIHEALAAYRVRREWFKPAALARLLFTNLTEELLDQGEELGLTFDQVTAHWESAPLSVEMVKRAASQTLEYWQSAERTEDEQKPFPVRTVL